MVLPVEHCVRHRRHRLDGSGAGKAPRGVKDARAVGRSAPFGDVLGLCATLRWNNLSSRCSGLGAVRGPYIHQPASLVEQVAASICGLGLVVDDMRERRFCNLAWKIRALRRPVSEGAAEAMRCELGPVETLKRLEHRHVGQWSASADVGENVLAALPCRPRAL